MLRFSEMSGDASPRSDFINIIQILDKRRREIPSEIAVRFYYDDAGGIAEARFDSWTWAELANRSRSVSGELKSTGLIIPGARILLVYQPGLSFIAAFLGCLRAGTVPVPVPAPRRAEGIHRWLHIARDAAISGILCSDDLTEVLEPLQRALGHGFCIASTAADPAVPCPPAETAPAAAIGADQIAFLQYTSGSTSDPKGVMVTHGNLMANLQQIATAFEYGPQDRSASWLPHYHDMGLIDGILSPVFNGFPVSLMSPASFLRRPMRFLELAAHCRATVIGGPNFSYEHCVSRYTAEAAENLDLSSIRIAYNGAEPIRPQTLRRFAGTFAPHGFNRTAFYCCYGQAEATLFQTGNGPDDPPFILSVSRDELTANGKAIELPGEAGQEHERLELAACGRPAEGLDLVLVDPEERRRLGDGLVGEIWIRGASVTPGYWGRARESAETFGQVFEDTPGWRRTGDLGFRLNGQIYITGRLKDLIIIRGQNHHPEDIEQTVFSSHPALAQGRAGAFSLEKNGEEQVGVICELTREGLRNLDSEAVLQAVRSAVARTHGLKVAVVALIRPGSLPRTPSGKVRRFACRQALLAGELRIEARWDARPGESFDAPKSANRPTWLQDLQAAPSARRSDSLRQRVREEIAFLARLPDGEMPPADAGFFELGLDSVALVSFGATLERELGVATTSTLIFEHPTVDALVSYLAGTLFPVEQTGIGVIEPQRDSSAAPAPGDTTDTLSSELEALKTLLYAAPRR